jgi:hypothetical protein
LPFGIGRILSTALCGKQDFLMDYLLAGRSSSFFKQRCLRANSFQSYSCAATPELAIRLCSVAGSAGNIEATQARLEKSLARKSKEALNSYPLG